jgi:hypothetical protein
MSPEQVMGEPLDCRSDVFSMGLALYTLATNKLAFNAESPMKIAIKIASDPMDDHAEELDELLPGLGDLLEKATHKEPELRYQTAREFGDALRDLHASLSSPPSIRDMLLTAGWRPTGELPPPDPNEFPRDLARQLTDDEEEEDTDPGLEAEEPTHQRTLLEVPTDATSVADEVTATDVPAAAEGTGGHDETTADEATDAGELSAAPPETPQARPGPDDVDPPEEETGEQSAPEEPASAAPFDPEATPIEDHAPTVAGPGPRAAPDLILPGDVGYTGAPPVPPRVPRPLPPGMRPPPAPQPQHPGMRPPPPPRAPGPWPGPPPMGSPQRPVEQTLGAGGAQPRPRVQPVRDYRGRVVHKPPPPPEAGRAGNLEKLGVAAAFVLLLGAVAVIVVVQMLPVDVVDPRYVASDPELSDPPLNDPGEAPPEEPAAAATPDAEPPGGAVEEEEPDAEPNETTPAPAPATEAPREGRSKGTSVTAAARAPTEGGEAEPTPKPKPRPRGTVTVNSYPWSQVFIDGRDRGRTPIVGLSIPAGPHTVRLVFPTRDNEELIEKIEVEAGREAKVVHRMTDGGAP